MPRQWSTLGDDRCRALRCSVLTGALCREGTCQLPQAQTPEDGDGMANPTCLFALSSLAGSSCTLGANGQAWWITPDARTGGVSEMDGFDDEQQAGGGKAMRGGGGLNAPQHMGQGKYWGFGMDEASGGGQTNGNLRAVARDKRRCGGCQ
eukprot:GGOE01008197.1.p2 GENE.GGOE01008197.1~~GGOE01008197.1.p2  ORF type:complete len:150 (-),score=7.84 GGOE01008197.1:353-802(-)